MTSWDERFQQGDYPQDPNASPVLRAYSDQAPSGRALDVATGTGRNATFLASSGYEVDAIDQSREGLRIARQNAADRGVASRVNFIQTDVPSHEFPRDTYGIVTVSYYRAVDRFPDLKAALVDGGYLFVEHHLRSAEPTSVGPSSDRYRFSANELIQSCLDLTVLYYDAGTDRDGRRATTRLLARKSSGLVQAYPERPTIEAP